MEKRCQLLWALLPAAAVAVTAVAGGVTGSPFPDAADYRELAAALWRTGSFECGGVPAGLRTPGYPVFLALTGGTAWSYLPVNCAFVFGISLLTLRFATDFKIRLPWISVLLLTASAGFIAAGSVALTEIAFVFWLLLGCRLIHKKHLYSGAFILSMATLTRPIGLLLFLPFAVYLVWKHTPPLRLIAALLLTLSLPAAWTLRNLGRYGYANYTSIDGFNLLLYKAGGYLSARTGTPVVEQHQKLLAQLPVTLEQNPFEASRHAGKLGRELILEHLPGFSWWCIRNLPCILMPDITPLLERLQLSHGNLGTYDILNREGAAAAVKLYVTRNPIAAAALAVYLPLYLATLLLASAGTLLLFRRRRYDALLAVALLAGYFTLLPIGNLDWRFRLPLLPVIVLLANYAVSEYASRRKDSTETAGQLEHNPDHQGD